MKKTALLKNVGIFSDLAEHELDVIASFSRYYHYGPGEVVFEEGSQPEELFVIKKGEIVIGKHRKESDMEIARFIAGEAFGELELLDESPRSSGATARDNTTLLVFPMRGILFSDIIGRYPKIFARVLHKLLAMIAGRIRRTNKLISENTPWVQDLKRQLLRDKLTGLYNRTYLEEDFAELLPQHGDGTSLLMVKPDDFKAINDRCGHDVGDRVLRLLADTLGSLLEKGGTAVRYRGDEFALILPGAGVEIAKHTAEDVRLSVGALSVGDLTGGSVRTITVSIGVGVYPQDGTSSAALIQSAFELMFKARNNGGDRILQTPNDRK
jgi:diguanylate cyclase (GGDEF)-like protein